MFYASGVKQTWTIQMWSGTIPFTVSRTPNPGARGLYYARGVNGFNIPVVPFHYLHRLCLPAAVRVPQPGRGQVQLHSSEEDPGRGTPARQPAGVSFGDPIGCQRP